MIKGEGLADVTRHHILDENDTTFALLATTDGLFDVITSQAAAKVCY